MSSPVYNGLLASESSLFLLAGDGIRAEPEQESNIIQRREGRAPVRPKRGGRVECIRRNAGKTQKGWTWWREARFGPGRTTHGYEPCGASETRRIATGGLAEQAGRLRFATSAARREHGKDARRRGVSHAVARRSQAMRIADDWRGRGRPALRGRDARRVDAASSVVENASLALFGAASRTAAALLSRFRQDFDPKTYMYTSSGRKDAENGQEAAGK